MNFSTFLRKTTSVLGIFCISLISTYQVLTCTEDKNAIKILGFDPGIQVAYAGTDETADKATKLGDVDINKVLDNTTVIIDFQGDFGAAENPRKGTLYEDIFKKIKTEKTPIIIASFDFINSPNVSKSTATRFGFDKNNLATTTMGQDIDIKTGLYVLKEIWGKLGSKIKEFICIGLSRGGGVVGGNLLIPLFDLVNEKSKQLVKEVNFQESDVKKIADKANIFIACHPAMRYTDCFYRQAGEKFGEWSVKYSFIASITPKIPQLLASWYTNYKSDQKDPITHLEELLKQKKLSGKKKIYILLHIGDLINPQKTLDNLNQMAEKFSGVIKIMPTGLQISLDVMLHTVDSSKKSQNYNIKKIDTNKVKNTLDSSIVQQETSTNISIGDDTSTIGEHVVTGIDWDAKKFIWPSEFFINQNNTINIEKSLKKSLENIHKKHPDKFIMSKEEIENLIKKALTEKEVFYGKSDSKENLSHSTFVSIKIEDLADAHSNLFFTKLKTKKIIFDHCNLTFDDNKDNHVDIFHNISLNIVRSKKTAFFDFLKTSFKFINGDTAKQNVLCNILCENPAYYDFVKDGFKMLVDDNAKQMVLNFIILKEPKLYDFLKSSFNDLKDEKAKQNVLQVILSHEKKPLYAFFRSSFNDLTDLKKLSLLTSIVSQRIVDLYDILKVSMEDPKLDSFLKQHVLVAIITCKTARLYYLLKIGINFFSIIEKERFIQLIITDFPQKEPAIYDFLKEEFIKLREGLQKNILKTAKEAKAEQLYKELEKLMKK